MRALAEKADAFMALHQPQSHNTVAAAVAATSLESEEDTIAAVKGAAKKNYQKGKKKSRQQRNVSPSDERKSPLCWLHIKFGNKARRCEQLCAWPTPAEN
jgi:hypothetical protein